MPRKLASATTLNRDSARAHPYRKSDTARFLIRIKDTLSRRIAWYFIEDIRTVALPNIDKKAQNDDHVKMIVFSEGSRECPGDGVVMRESRWAVERLMGREKR